MVRVEEARTAALAAADRLDPARVELSNLVIARLTIRELTTGSADADQAGWVIASGGGPRPGVRGAARDEAVYARIREIFIKAADNVVHAGQAACWYSWMTPPSLRMPRISSVLVRRLSRIR